MKKRTKQIVLLIIIVLVLNIVTYGLLLGYKYLNHKKLIGEYELVDQNLDDTEYKLKVSIYKWAKGEEKNLKCDLWNCIGYDFGTYSIKNNMITVYRNNGLAMTEEGNLVDKEYRGLSTDSKPIENITNGSVFIEIDTGKIYMFDAKGTQWKEL